MTVASNDTPDSEAARILIDRQMLDYRTSTPGIVVAVDPEGRTVDVQPAISMTQTLDGQARGIQLPVLQGVPLAVMGSTSAGWFVCVGVAPGDEGLLVVCDRAIDNWQHGGGVAIPPVSPSPRHHDLTDAVFLPGLQRMSGAIPAFPTEGVEVRNRAGTVKLAVTGAGVTITAPTVTVQGNMNVVGELKSNGVQLDTHQHLGGSLGEGTTGGPT